VIASSEVDIHQQRFGSQSPAGVLGHLAKQESSTDPTAELAEASQSMDQIVRRLLFPGLPQVDITPRRFGFVALEQGWGLRPKSFGDVQD